jgi:hypothetical protein
VLPLIHNPPEMFAVPFKANADRRHRIPKQQDRVTNWSEYDAALRQRGSLTVWFTEEAIAAWRAEPRTTRGGQPHYSALAITTFPRRLSRVVLHRRPSLTEMGRKSHSPGGGLIGR